ncbi:hypothetical protein D3C84_836370 [compost metagenome]
MAAVLHPLHALELDELAHDLVAQHLSKQWVSFKCIAGFLKRLRQGLDTARGDLLQAQLVEVLVAHLIDFELAVDAIQTGCDDRGADQIRVAASIWQAELQATVRHANHCRAVVGTKGNEGWRPSCARQRVTDDQTLVGVNGGRSEGTQRWAVGQQSGGKVIGHL